MIKPEELTRLKQEHAGRVALVVGGSGGIGSAIAYRLGQQGARVAIAYAKSRERAEQVAMEIGAIGGDAVALPCDVRTETACQSVVEQVREMWGGLDILVYAAGIDLWKLTMDTTQSEWRQMVEVNLEGAFLTAKAALGSMASRGWGRIVFVGSIWGEVGAALEVAYSATKAGLAGMTRALAKEVARWGITVNAVAPGVIETPMNDRFDEEERSALLARIPVGRFGRGDDVAHAVQFLASEQAGYITGHVLWVTGGFDPLP